MALSGHTSYAWVPDGIISFTMHMRGKIHDQRRTWARARLESEGRKTNICKIALHDEESGLMMIAGGFWYNKLDVGRRIKLKS